MTVLALSEAYGTVSVAAGAVVTDADGADEEAGTERSEDRGTGKELASLPEAAALVAADGATEDTKLAVNDADALEMGAETRALEAAGAKLLAGAHSEYGANATAQRTALVSFVKAMLFFEPGAGERVGLPMSTTRLDSSILYPLVASSLPLSYPKGRVPRVTSLPDIACTRTA